LIEEAFLTPVGRIFAFYPDAPCSWLIDKAFIETGGSLDPAVELNTLRQSVMKLLPGKDLYAGHVRAIPFNRMLKHDKIRIVRGVGPIDLIPKYPGGTDCSL
jgi:hypothetical protein